MGAICEKIERALDSMGDDLATIEQYESELISDDYDALIRIAARLSALLYEPTFKARMDNGS